ncbi:DNA ligase 1-like [Mytilus californianus]|uniref:DNA ligase 1-like n=1 Tax=Mytilus californianus TaxID=6549 RepID=UPI0022464588|nr:DNA ligase 1-like [Mytilus californianus]
MAVLISFGLVILILVITNISDTDATTTNFPCDKEEKNNSLMFFSAGFMTASLVFSIGCFVSKRNTTPSNKNIDDSTISDQGEQLFATAPDNVYVNEGSCESNRKSYGYCNIEKNSENCSQSSKSEKRFKDRESYDMVNHNRAKSHLANLANDEEDPNPYNHVTVDMEVTEYDNACFLKPRAEVMDPTYSHLSEVNLQIESSNVTKQKGDGVKNQTNSSNAETNSKDQKQKTTEKQKQKKPETEKRKQTKPEIPQKPEIKIEDRKQKEPMVLVNGKEEKQEHKICRNAEIKESINMKNGETDNETNEIKEGNRRNRKKFGYSFVQKKKGIPNEDSAKTYNGSETFEVSCDGDEKSFKIRSENREHSSAEKSTETKSGKSSLEVLFDQSNGSFLFISKCEESKERRNEHVSPETNSGKLAFPNGRDETSSNDGSESETDLLPPGMAINILYEDVPITKGNVVIGAVEESSDQELESPHENSEEDYSI